MEDKGALIRPGIRGAQTAPMTEPEISAPPPKQAKHVNTQATSRSLRHLAREAAEQGERLVEIARRLKIAPSTLHHWAREDGFRRKDVKARASLALGPKLPDEAEYPEMLDLYPRARLARLRELSDEARLRAVAAIEVGYLDYGLKWLREAQKLDRARRALGDYFADYPPPELEEEDTLSSRACEAAHEKSLAEKEGREPVYRALTPELQAEQEEENFIQEAIEGARLERMTEERGGRAPEPGELERDRRLNFQEDARESWRLKQEVKKCRFFPGHRDPPPIWVVSNGRSILPRPEPERPDGAPRDGMNEAFPMRFTWEE